MMYQSDPVLASLNIKESMVFYEQTLGFRISWQDDNYGIVSRDKISIHFWLCDNRIFPENTSCYVYVDEVEPLYKEYCIVGVVHPNGKLERKPWGMLEFAILDNDGNMIKFGQQIK
jgi:catechol 2,3-dioxygenase-like lactoylglutathione lyase family enzyme